IDPQSPDYLFSRAIIRSYLQSPKKIVGDQANAARVGEVDVAAERAKVPAAIAGGVPEAAAMARFRERTGQDFTVQPAVASPAGINPNALKLAQPQNFADF